MRSNHLFMAGAFALSQALLLAACSKPAPIESAEVLGGSLDGVVIGEEEFPTQRLPAVCD